jgi:hypothetical protein
MGSLLMSHPNFEQEESTVLNRADLRVPSIDFAS